MIEFTTFLAVDREHLRELKVVAPGWRVHRPEIWRRPMAVCIDCSVVPKDLDFLEHSNLNIFPWTLGAPSQRAKMLASFILLAPEVVKTPWILKLDTDCTAERRDDRWCGDELVAGNPVFVASPWGYTKPANAIAMLDKWANEVVPLAGKAPLNIVAQASSKLVSTPGRIISWCFFGRTDWCKWAADLCGGVPPLYSHDTYLWYVAKRSGATFKTVKMKSFGWTHGRV